MCGGGGGSDGRIKDTVAQKKLAEIAAKRFNLYQKHFVPLEQQFMSDVFALRSPGEFQNVEGYVSAIQNPEYQKARNQIENQLTSSGVDPSSGQFQNASAAITEAQQRGTALGTTEALSGQTDRFYQGIQNIVALGEGQAGSTMSGLGDIGDIAAARAQSSAKTAFGKSRIVPTMITSALGLGAGLLMGSSKSGTPPPPPKTTTPSDVRLKESIEYLGKSSKGHKVYTWNWNDKAVELGINDPTTGVLAQEIMKTNPDAVSKGAHGYYVVNYNVL